MYRLYTSINFVHLLAILIGLAAGWQWSGIDMILRSALEPWPQASLMHLAITFLAASLGPWLPERLFEILARIRGWSAAEHPKEPGINGGLMKLLQAVRNGGESSSWLPVAVLAIASGLVSLLTLLAVEYYLSFYSYLLNHFFWTQVSLALLHWISAALLTGLLWMMVGAVAARLISAVTQQSGSYKEPLGGVTGLLVGIGLARLTFNELATASMAASQIYMTGILPMFVLAGLAVWQSQKNDQDTNKPEDSGEATKGSGRIEGLIWLSLVVCGVAIVLTAGGWLACRSVLDGDWPQYEPFGWLILVVSFGVLLGFVYSKNRKRSASGCGMALWTVGVGGLFTTMITVYCPGSSTATVIQMLLTGLLSGHAVSYIGQALMFRMNSKSLGHAQLISTLCAGVAIGLLVGYWWVLQVLGPVGMLATGSLLLLTSGGLLQLYENRKDEHLQFHRLGLVFGTLAASILLFPMNAEQWADIQNNNAAETQINSQWRWPYVKDKQVDSHVCIIGDAPIQAKQWLHTYDMRGDVLQFPSGTQMRGEISETGAQTKISQGWNRLRLERLQYDMIYQRNEKLYPHNRFFFFSKEWYEYLKDNLAVGGRLIVDIPERHLSKQATGVIVASLAHDSGSNVAWRKLSDNRGKTVFRFMVKQQAKDALLSFEDGWRPIQQLCTPENFPVHSVRQDHLTRYVSDNEK
jgi:hypothetical protein